MVELLITGGVVATGALLMSRRTSPATELGKVDVATDLPCPWCRADTAENDAKCPGCGQVFG